MPAIALLMRFHPSEIARSGAGLDRGLEQRVINAHSIVSGLRLTTRAAAPMAKPSNVTLKAASHPFPGLGLVTVKPSSQSRSEIFLMFW